MNKCKFMFYVLLFVAVFCNLNAKVFASEELQSSLETPSLPETKDSRSSTSLLDDVTVESQSADQNVNQNVNQNENQDVNQKGNHDASVLKVLVHEYKNKVKAAKDKFDQSGYKFDFSKRVFEKVDGEIKLNEDYVYAGLGYDIELIKHVDALISKLDLESISKEHLKSLYLLFSDFHFHGYDDFLDERLGDENLDRVAKKYDVVEIAAYIKGYLDAVNESISDIKKRMLEVNVNRSSEDILNEIHNISLEGFHGEAFNSSFENIVKTLVYLYGF
ncbi:hypothetical protein [Borrelia persica]|uniref:hypothetical protein n=1 Tax=Borrelia persica TaxID=44448 RepID=UPI0004653072|nr:hypothetical protein [Borrelia persica]